MIAGASIAAAGWVYLKVIKPVRAERKKFKAFLDHKYRYKA